MFCLWIAWIFCVSSLVNFPGISQFEKIIFAHISQIGSFFILSSSKKHLSSANLRSNPQFKQKFHFVSISFTHTQRAELITETIPREPNYMFICMHFMILSSFNYQSDRMHVWWGLNDDSILFFGNWILMVFKCSCTWLRSTHRTFFRHFFTSFTYFWARVVYIWELK